MNMKNVLSALLAFLAPSAVLAITLTQSPLFIASTEPRVMLVASRDHQLSIKAYTDYTDIDSTGGLDITYSDGINYYGYYDTGKCYTYSTTNNRFEPAAAVSTGHQCSGGTYWSGNFMNWATMTRMDVLRKTFYGGYRSTDSTTETVLERHFLPVEVHAFSKVYNPGNNATLKLYIPSAVVGSSNTAISLCNVSNSTSTTLTGQMSFPLPTPLIKVAGGAWPQWDSSEVTQCAVNSGQSTQPTTLLGTYNARIKVCDTIGGVESNCKNYTHPTTGVTISKPVGLLQQYGDVDALRRVRFGLITGSYAANKSGGVLRKNTGFLSNNNNTSVLSASICGNNNANDEIDACTGQFINQGSAQAGIINTLNRFHIAGFKYTSSGGNGSHQYSCNSPGILSFTNGQCVDWGNPIGETYLEALRYFANAGATAAFDVSDSSPTNILSSIPKVTWTDPLPSTEWCAISNIVVLSTGINSFDTDELTAFTPTGSSSTIDANALTQTVGDSSHEDINSHDYLIGNNGSTSNNQCTSKTVSNLATAKGICPEAPSIAGGYGIAGLAYAPKTIDLRPGYASLRNDRWGGTSPINADWALRQPLDTYTVQLGETLPSFKVAVGSGAVTLLPACQANSDSNASAWTTSSSGWRNCSMTNLIVEENVASASVGSDSTAKTNTCSGNGTASARCFRIAWEDSTWGNDYDMDGIQRLGYCVGSACDTFRMLCPSTGSANAVIGVGLTAGWTAGSTSSSQIRIATCVIQTQAGHTLTFGYTLAGSSSDGASFPILRKGGNNFNVGQTLPSSGVSSASTVTLTTGSSTAQLLNNPLWYAAKYGGFIDSTPTVGTPKPDVQSEWDLKNNLTGVATPDGDPDNYFNVRNPANLITALSNVFDRASQRTGDAASAATSSTSLQISSRIFQAKFSPIDWSGQLVSLRLDTTPGALALIQEWDAGQIINTQASRSIITMGATDGAAFNYASLTAAGKGFLDNNAAGTTDNCGPERVDYLRGSNTNEGPANQKFICPSSSSNITKLRQRNTSKLGDIVDSDPLFVGAPSAGFSDFQQPGYSAFRTANLNRKPAVYVGANDGMLHGFDVSLTGATSTSAGTPSPTAGQELIAYVPSQIFPNLSKLTDQTYNKNHLYFVDGSPMAADADLDSSAANNWRTVLVGSLGPGGKGYYALDITNPSGFSEAAAASAVLWEFDETDMGNVIALPPANDASQAKQIVKMANGKWAVIVGNGYNSVEGKAVLYVLFIEDGLDGVWGGSDFVKIVADAPVAPATTANNGLSTPVPFDSDGDGLADTVYAGDLKGNMWKFLVGPNTSDASVTSVTSTWKVAFSGQPLFTAVSGTGTVQPIISPPEVDTHLIGGQVVLFGTGKYLELTDITDTSSQTFYGIWDKNDGTTKVGTRAADLLQQTISILSTPTVDQNFRVISTNPINWRTGSITSVNPANCTPAASCNPSHMGWYIDLPTSKERTVGIPRIISTAVFFNTLIPSDAPCDAGGTGWFMGVDFFSGAQINTALFDTNYNGYISNDNTDVITAGFRVGASVHGTKAVVNDSGGDSIIVTPQTGGGIPPNLFRPPASTKGRMNWREIAK